MPKTAAYTEDTVHALSRTIGHEQAAVTIRQFRFVDSSSLRQVYEVGFSNGRSLELLIPLASMLRLLRWERRIINSEADVIQWLGTVLYQPKKQLVDPGLTQEDKGQEEEEEEEEEQEVRKAEVEHRAREVENVEGYQEEATDVGKGSSKIHDREGPRRRSSGTGSQPDGIQCSHLEVDLGLLHLLPRLVDHSPSSEPLDTLYTLWQPRRTKTIASLSSPLTTTQRSEVNYDLGRITCCFSRLTSPNGRFGCAGPIIACCNVDPSSSLDGMIKRPSTPANATEGCTTWSEAFHLMLEDILRDAEDMAVSVPYPVLRKHFLRLHHHLDEVTVPRLVFTDGAEDSNVLVASDEEEGLEDKAHDESEDEENEKEDEDESDGTLHDGPARNPCWRQNQYNKGSTSTITSKPQTVLGFRSWSNAIFGDPLIATIFSNKPSPSFLNGYRHNNPSASPFTSSQTSSHEATSAEIRLLLYQAYHATVTIVNEFYHPKKDSTTRELAARRKLNGILLRLNEVEERDVDGQRPEPVHRRPSGEMSPAKKLKSVEKERELRERKREKEGVGSSKRRGVEVAE